MAGNKVEGTSAKHVQINKASTQTFIVVAVAAVVVSMSLVLLNILWGNAKFNSKVHGRQEQARDQLIDNIAAVGPLQESFERLEIGADLIQGQPEDKKNSEVILDALPSRFDFPELAVSIDNLARQSSVTLTSFRGTDLGESALTSSPSPFPEQIPFIMDIEGSYQDITVFLSNLENSIRPIKVQSIEMSGIDSKLSISVTAETSYQPAFDLTIQEEGV